MKKMRRITNDQFPSNTRDGNALYLTLTQAVEAVPFSKATLRRAIHSGDLPAYKPCGRIVVRRDQLRAWVEKSISQATQGDSPAGRSVLAKVLEKRGES